MVLVASVVFSDEGHNVPLLSRGEGLIMPNLLEILASSGPGRPNPRLRQAIKSSTQRATQVPAASEYDKPLFERPELWNSIMQTGLGMLAGSSDFGATGLSSFGKAASQFGLPAYQQGRRRAAISDAMTGAPEAMQRLMSIDPELAMQMTGGASDPRIMSGPNGAIYRIGATGEPELVVPGVPDEPNLTNEQWQFSKYQEENPGATYSEFREWQNSLEPADERSMDTDTRRRMGYYMQMTTPVMGDSTILDRLEQMEAPPRGQTLLQKWAPTYTGADQEERATLEALFIEAVVRPASGAAISEAEYARTQKAYFPQPGDDYATVLLKARLRRNYVDTVLLAGVPQ